MLTGKFSVLIEQDEHGYYAWCPELEGCQSQGQNVEDALANIRQTIDLFPTRCAQRGLARYRTGLGRAILCGKPCSFQRLADVIKNAGRYKRDQQARCYQCLQD